MNLQWYDTLIKPALTPPSWVFGPAWTILYILIAISFIFFLKKHSNILPPSHKATGGQGKNVGMLKTWRWGVAAFCVQLFLNLIWSPIFFTLQNPFWAFVDIIALWLAIIWTIIIFYKISRWAALLLIPYFLWVSFAAYLNYSILLLN